MNEPLRLYREAEWECEGSIYHGDIYLHSIELVTVAYSVVPWCAEHDMPIDKVAERLGLGLLCRSGEVQLPDPDPCRLEEPARHIVLEVQDE